MPSLPVIDTLPLAAPKPPSTPDSMKHQASNDGTQGTLTQQNSPGSPELREYTQPPLSRQSSLSSSDLPLESGTEIDDSAHTEGLEEATTFGLEPCVQRPLWKIWRLEVLSIVFSFTIFTAIVTVLAIYDQKQLPGWPLRISLNSVLALLTTVTKAAFMWPVSHAISQTQWSWFLQDRPLYDFHLIDQASRGGAWGSLTLLWRIRHKHFVALAAVLSVICVLTSPVTQLAIDYPNREVPSSNEARLSTIGMLNFTIARGLGSLNNAVDTAITRTPWPVGDIEYDLTSSFGALCSTGNCTFDEFHSLGICVEFADITSHLKVQRFDDFATVNFNSTNSPLPKVFLRGFEMWNVSLPGAYHDSSSLDLIHQGKLAFIVDMLGGNKSIAFQDNKSLIQTKIASFGLIYTAPAFEDEGSRDRLRQRLREARTVPQLVGAIPKIRHNAMEILFHLCVQSYRTSVYKGIENTVMVNSSARPVEQDSGFFMDLTCTPVDKVNTTTLCNYRDLLHRYNDTIHLEGPVVSSAAPKEFGATFDQLVQMSTQMKFGINGYCQDRVGQGERSLALELLARGNVFPKPFWTSFFLDTENLLDPARSTKRVQTLFTNIASSISSALRESKTGRQLTVDVYNVTGTAWKEESYVNITWGWLTFLAVELMIATVFLVLTIVAQVKMRASQKSLAATNNYTSMFDDYKDSYMAPLLALSQASRSAAGGGLQSRTAMNDTAKKIHVRLEGNEVIPSKNMTERV